MPTARSVRSQLRSLPERSVRFRRAVRLRLLRLRHPGRILPGVLSIVVPTHNVEEFIDEALRSMRFQEYTDVEIIVVDDSSTDGSARVARAHARRDPRVRVVSRPNGGPSAARNTGVAHARGEFLAFMDPDDLTTPTGYRRAVKCLQRSGSDFVVMGYDRVTHNVHKPAAKWINALHSARRTGTTVEECPQAMTNAVPWSKVFRRSFYDAAGLCFPEGVLYEDQPWSAAAFARAEAFDVLPYVLISWRIRGDQSSITQNAATTANLRQQVDATRASLAVLDAEAPATVGDLRATQLLAYNMPVFTRNMAHADDDFYALLREAVGELLERVDQSSYLHSVPAQAKVLNRLIALDRRTDATEFIETSLHVNCHHSSHTGEWFTLDVPVPGGIEPEYLRMSDSELSLSTRILRMSLDEERLTVGGWAFVRNVDAAEYPLDIRIFLVGPDDRRYELHVDRHHEPRLDIATAHWYCDYRSGGFTASAPLRDIAFTEGEWRLDIELHTAGLARSGSLGEVSRAGSAGRTVSVIHGDHLLTLASDEGRMQFSCAPLGPMCEDVTVGTDGVLQCTFAATECRRVELVGPRGEVVASTAAESVSPGRWHARLKGERADGAAAYTPRSIRIRDRSGATRLLLAGPDVPAFPGRPAGGAGDVQVSRGPLGTLEIRQRTLAATQIEVFDDDVVVHLRGPLEGGATVALAGQTYAVDGTIEGRHGDETIVRFSLWRAAWGRDHLFVPQGRYPLSLMHSGEASPAPIAPAHGLFDQLPIDCDRATAQMLVEVNGAGALTVLVRPPLDESERGTRNQRLLREQAHDQRTDTDSVFFRSLYGEVTNCNALGVHEELAARGATLDRIWSIADLSVPVPEGGRGLVEGTKEWHHALASARYHMVNVHQLPWFHKPQGQVIIQTMHGYPYKQMGHDLWSARSYFFSTQQVASYDERAREWDFFVSPASYATELLRAAFLTPAHSEAEVLEIGYPRNDVLLSDRAAEVRRKARATLGIADNQTAILYAPTYRDYLSGDDMTAERVDFLDPEQAARLLGEDYVILMRGHAFVARTSDRLAAHPRIIDCSEHPDVNELILASDVGVLDYSSLRFDYALTDKPMLFLVPDLERYEAARPGILEYAPTAPGPMVATTREVVDLVRDIDLLASSYAGARKDFRREYADLDDGHAAARLVDAVMVPRGDAPTRS